MPVTVLGIVTLVMLSQSLKAFFPMLVTVLGITTSPPAPLYCFSTPLSMVKSSSPSLVAAGLSWASGASSRIGMPSTSAAPVFPGSCASSVSPSRVRRAEGSISTEMPSSGIESMSIETGSPSIASSISPAISRVAFSAIAAGRIAHASNNAASNKIHLFKFRFMSVHAPLKLDPVASCRRPGAGRTRLSFVISALM